MQYLTYMCLSKLPVRSNMSQANAIQIGEGGISKIYQNSKTQNSCSQFSSGTSTCKAQWSLRASPYGFFSPGETPNALLKSNVKRPYPPRPQEASQQSSIEKYNNIHNPTNVLRFRCCNAAEATVLVRHHSQAVASSPSVPPQPYSHSCHRQLCLHSMPRETLSSGPRGPCSR